MKTFTQKTKDKYLLRVKGECLQWKGWLDKDGYGGVKIDGKNYRVHRVALEISLGRKLTSKEVVMHLCDNPRCYSVKHLKIGTVKENNQYARQRVLSAVDRFFPDYRKVYKNPRPKRLFLKSNSRE